MKTSKVYIFNTIVITLYLLLVIGGCTSSAESIPKPQKPLPSWSIERAQELFRARSDVENLRSAVRSLAEARDPEKRNYEVEWKFAEYSCYLGRQMNDEAEREKAFNAGKEAARIASRLQPDRPEGHFWYAANLGELARLSPISVGLRSVDDIRAAANRVIEIEPGYQGASAFVILAQIELSTYLFGGKPQKAAELLEKGLDLEKNNSVLRVDLARAYLALNKPDKAREQLQYVLKMTPRPDHIPEHQVTVALARKLLETKF